MNLLIVEDDKDTIQSYEDRIGIFNGNNDIQIVPTIVRDVNQAEMELKTPTFDAAIIDLKLTPGTAELDGVKVIDNILNDLRIPVFVVSGSIAQYAKEETPLFKKKDRDGSFDDVLNEIIEIYNTGITKILGHKGVIDQYLQTIFWSHLSNSIDLWKNDKYRANDVKEKSLLRYTILHMHEYLDDEIEKYHPSEFYIAKPIKKDISTGDIISAGKERFLLITPSCDMVLRENDIRNADFVHFIKIKDLSEVVKNYNRLNVTTSSTNDDRKRLTNYIENKNQRYHFIPNTTNIKAGLIDFQDKITITTKQLNNYIRENSIVRIATVSTPFLKDIISRSSSYFSRQGSPDFIIDQIYKDLFS